MRKLYKCDKGYHTVEKPDEAEWIDIIDPHADDIQLLTETFGIPPEFLEYLSDADERPRIERQDQWIMTIVRIPVPSHSSTMPYKTVPMGIICSPDTPNITVCYHENILTADFADHSRRKNLCVNDHATFTLRIIYSAAYWYLHYLKTLTEDVVGAEKDLERSVKNDDLLWLMRMQKSLVFFNTSIKGNSLLLERIPKVYGSSIDLDFLDDVQIELKQADSTVEIYSDILEGTMDSYASIISNNVNAVVKRMTALSIILMVPTFMASLYGMNVDLYISHFKYAFWFVLALSALLTAGAFLWLRRLRWI